MLIFVFPLPCRLCAKWKWLKFDTQQALFAEEISSVQLSRSEPVNTLSNQLIRPQTWIVKLWNRSYRHQTKQAEKYVATLSQYTESTLQFFWTRISTTLVTSNTWIVTQLGWIPANLQSTILPLTFLRLNPSSTHGCKAKGKFHFPNNFLSTQNRTTMESLTTQESVSWGLFPPPQSTRSNPC